MHQHFTNPSLQVNEDFKSYVNDLLSQVTEDLGDAFAEVTNFFSEIFQSESLGLTLPFINISIEEILNLNDLVELFEDSF